jgi:hypothetical protein
MPSPTKMMRSSSHLVSTSTMSSRPVHRVTKVHAQLKIMNIFSIDTVNQTFSAELHINSRWTVTDPDHIKDALEKGKDQLDVDWEPEWVPRFSLDYCIAREDRQQQYGASEGPKSRAASSAVTITGKQRLHVTLSEQFDLQAFPFDLQNLNIHLSLDNCGCLLPLDPEDAGAMVSIVQPSLADFRLRFTLFHNHSFMHPDVQAAHDELRSDAKSGSKSGSSSDNIGLGEKHQLVVVLLCERSQRYYGYNYLVLLECIGFASLASFTVHWRQVDARLGIDITLLLVAFAFKHEIASNVPDIAYLTTLDYFAITVIGFLFLVMLLHAGLGAVIYDCDTMTGECTMGEYSLWDSSVREAHWNVSADPSLTLQRERQDDHMAIGYLTDFWAKCSYAALWVLWNLHFWLWTVRRQINWKVEQLKRAKEHAESPNTAWSEARGLPKPMSWYEHEDETKETDLSTPRDDEDKLTRYSSGHLDPGV